MFKQDKKKVKFKKNVEKKRILLKRQIGIKQTGQANIIWLY